MNKLIFFLVMIALFCTPVEGQKRKTSKTKPKAAKSTRLLKKTTKTNRKKVVPKKPKIAQEVLVNSNSVQVFPRCSYGSSHLNITAYGKIIFTEAVKVGVKSSGEADGYWVQAPNGWSGLKEGKVLKALFDQLEPDTLEVYPGLARYNSTPINMVVMIRDKWYQEDLETVDQIMREHVVSFGFNYNFVPWECARPRKEANAEPKPKPLQILQ